MPRAWLVDRIHGFEKMESKDRMRMTATKRKGEETNDGRDTRGRMTRNERSGGISREVSGRVMTLISLYPSLAAWEGTDKAATFFKAWPWFETDFKY